MMRSALILTVGCWTLAAGCYFLDIDSWLMAAGAWLAGMVCWLFTLRYQLNRQQTINIRQHKSG
ncbi:hypothetical protein [Desulfonema magnum]|uniref:Uncharacterized protein n=1 Tax=Desulfonema magnum TaxID=45655 RepID=A0A975GKW4_9BACT|nr:hypothetical protein [Desulfonema magnum]QTA85181.1 Uncharacterized protein dnm_011860 [Desulfonema magnum]